MKFLVILLLFEFGFTMLIMAVNQPYKAKDELSNDEEKTRLLLEQELTTSCKNKIALINLSLIIYYVSIYLTLYCSFS